MNIDLQWIAPTAPAVASVIVAVVALAFNYRQNRGWKPVILVLQCGFDQPFASIEFEVWNRRKYPVVILILAMGGRQRSC
jgi:hypothetical protein